MGDIYPPMMDGMDSWDGSGSERHPYGEIPADILQALPSALSSLITSKEIPVFYDETLEVPARYYKSSKTIRIRPNSVTLEIVRHELVHAWEDKNGYMTEGSHTNIEYETYVINDIVYYTEHMIGEYGILSSGTVGEDDYEDYYTFISNSVNTNRKVNTNYFFANVGGFYNAFISAHSSSVAGTGSPNPNYSWHWIELLQLFELVDE